MKKKVSINDEVYTYSDGLRAMQPEKIIKQSDKNMNHRRTYIKGMRSVILLNFPIHHK